MRARHRIVTVLFPCTLVAGAALSQPCAKGAPQANALWGRMPLCFVANDGQMDARVAYYVPGSDLALYFTPEGITFALYAHAVEEPPSATSLLSGEPGRGETSRCRWIVKLDFVGANPVIPMGRRQTPTSFSYFSGGPDQWHTGLPSYAEIVYPDLWPGIDMICRGSLHRLKYEFVVHPNANPSSIRMAYRGASLRMDRSGNLQVQTPVRSFQDEAPTAYQDVAGRRVPVEARFDLGRTPTYGLEVGTYEPTLPLVIDPGVVVYCGYIGGSANESTAWSLAVDGAGCVYLAGYTPSTENTFPVDAGPDTTYDGGPCDAFVAKVLADGTGLLYCGYIGGTDEDYGNAIAVDAAGNAYVGGETASSQTEGFPLLGGLDATYNGGSDAFIAKVRADGTGLDYCGYIGGSGYDVVWGIAADDAGRAYATGETYSAQGTFPASSGPDTTYNGDADACVAKVKADGSGLDYAGYIGGASGDYGYAIAVDEMCDAYVVGNAESGEATFPVHLGPDTTYNGGDFDTFVAKVLPDGSGLEFCGYIGGDNEDSGHSMAVDDAGAIYVGGRTYSGPATFPETGGPDLTTNGLDDAYVAKVEPDGAGLAYCGYIGGSGHDSGNGIVVDGAGNAYLTGETQSTEATFPVLLGPDLTHNGGWDAFVAKVEADGSALLYAGYLGGIDQDYGHGIAVDSPGYVYVVGDTRSNAASFPVQVGPDLIYNGNGDAFVAKISLTCMNFDWDIPGARR